MNLEYLKSFKATVDYGDISSAAKFLNKSKSSISAAIKNLESHLGYELFDRSGYKPKLTEKGLKAIVIVEDLLSQNMITKDKLKEIGSVEKLYFRIAVDHLTPPKKIEDFVKKVIQEYPHTQFIFYYETLSGVEERVLSHQCDIGLTPFCLESAHYEKELLVNLDVIPVISKKLYQETKQIKSLKQVCVLDSSRLGKDIDYSSDKDFEWLLVSDHMMKKEFILNGLGWGYLEKESIQDYLDHDLMIFDEHASDKPVALYLVSLEQTTGTMQNKVKDLIRTSFLQ